MKAQLRLAALALTLSVGSACSLLISDEAEPIACSDEGTLGPPACDPGFSCQGGVCRAVVSVVAGAGGQAAQAGHSATPAGGGDAAGAAAEAGAGGAAPATPG